MGTGRRAGPRVGALLDAYELNAKSRGVTRTQYLVLKHLREHLGDLRPGAINDLVIARYRKSRNVQDSTLRRELNTLIAALNFGRKKRLISADEIPHIDLPPNAAPRELYLCEEQEAEMRRLALEYGDRDVILFVHLALRTGARKGAIEGLTYDRIDMKHKQIDYREPGRIVSKKRRVPVPIDDVLLDVLNEHWDGGDVRLLATRDMRARIDAFRKTTPFPWASAHVLRHTAATRWLRNGISIWAVSGLLGDTPETVTRVYGHHATQDLREAMGL